MLFELLIALLIAGAVLAVLAWSEVSEWVNSNTDSLSKYGEIIKEKLSSGNYKVVAGIFNKHQSKTATKEWEAKELDRELEAKFRHTNRLRIDV
jgi:hypothetical protein